MSNENLKFEGYRGVAYVNDVAGQPVTMHACETTRDKEIASKAALRLKKTHGINFHYGVQSVYTDTPIQVA